MRFNVQATEKEEFKIRQVAKIKNLSVAELFRSTALSRKADVQFDLELVLTILNCNFKVKAMHDSFQRDGLIPPADEFIKALEGATAAINKIAMI
jgi:hypothetical protein